MTTQDIIDIYNRTILKDSGNRLILHKVKILSPCIKSFVTYTWNVYMCNNNKKKIQYTIEKSFREVTENEVINNNETMASLLLEYLFCSIKNNNNEYNNTNK